MDATQRMNQRACSERSSAPVRTAYIVRAVGVGAIGKSLRDRVAATARSRPRVVCGRRPTVKSSEDHEGWRRRTQIKPAPAAGARRFMRPNRAIARMSNRYDGIDDVVL